MKNAILTYAEKIKDIPNWYQNFDISNVSPELKKFFDNNIYFIKRKTKTDFSIFEKEYGYSLPSDIGEYINLFWHPIIFGYYLIPECIILFPVVKYNNDSDNDILYQKHSIISMARVWKYTFGGNINKFLPIGWTGYSEGYILYEIGTGKIYAEDLDNEGTPESEPIANSLKELIVNLNVTPCLKFISKKV